MLAGAIPSASDLDIAQTTGNDLDDDSVADILQIPLHDQVGMTPFDELSEILLLISIPLTR